MRGKGEAFACDTSVALAALDASHEAHGACRRVLVELRPVLSGHAAFETHSVLTRLPIPLRLSPAQASSVLLAAFPGTCWLAPEDSDRLREALGALGVAGGSVYDALIGQTARVNGRVLLTRDRRAERTYRALDVPYRFVA
ncbi:MAG: type II toxin-antitoxin system VapC family toxin [Acidimicrobiia bacterium]